MIGRFQSGTCTLREAAIIGSVLTKVSVPVLHSGAALLKLADMDYTGELLFASPKGRRPLTRGLQARTACSSESSSTRSTPFLTRSSTRSSSTLSASSEILEKCLSFGISHSSSLFSGTIDLSPWR